jgi:hypothetical protein
VLIKPFQAKGCALCRCTTYEPWIKPLKPSLTSKTWDTEASAIKTESRAIIANLSAQVITWLHHKKTRLAAGFYAKAANYLAFLDGFLLFFGLEVAFIIVILQNISDPSHPAVRLSPNDLMVGLASHTSLKLHS